MKRKRSSHGSRGARKKARYTTVDQSDHATPSHAAHPVLQRLYPQVFTLRHYLLSQLPSSSKNRRRRISQLGNVTGAQSTSPTHDVDVHVARLLDSALVGTSGNPAADKQSQTAEERDQDIEHFTQHRPQASAAGTFKPGYFLQSEIVDFVVWRLFKRSAAHKPTHLLCHGFQRAGKFRRNQHVDVEPKSSIPGLVESFPNSCTKTLKDSTWCRLNALLGQGGDRIMMDMLLECSIFLPIDADLGNYYQLSGFPLSELRTTKVQNNNPTGVHVDPEASKTPSYLRSENRTPGAITFVRSRMLYAKAALNAKGGVRFGMRHIHVLNRFPNRDDRQQAIHIMRYMFPRQFDLHNVFTSKVDPRDTAMPFKDYTLREKEIHGTMCRQLGDKASNVQEVNKWKSRTPKRLRDGVVALIQKLQTLNQRCSYIELLRHFCPVEGMPLSPKPARKKSAPQPRQRLCPTAEPVACGTKPAPLPAEIPKIQQASVTELACPAAHVSAFCRAVLAKVIPRAFWGDENNKHTIMYWVDQFIDLRRFESLTLHQVVQRVHITTIAWLQPPGSESNAKLSKSDIDKRTEVFLEFVYWLFDSFLVPLIRTNFYVTESNVHRNKLFYFRHDVWRVLTEPALTTMRLDTFEEMQTESTIRLLSARQLGFSNIRLLPKKQGFRTITNLKRRQQVLRYGSMSLGRSINAVMTPAFNAITYEKSLRPETFGCSLFSVGDMFSRLAAFKASLMQRNLGGSRLYFAKVDVQACFDTIPQSRLLSMVDSLLSTPAYHTGKHVEMTHMGPLQRLDGTHVNPMPLKKYVAHSGAATDLESFGQLVQTKLAGTKANTIFINTNLQRQETKHDLMELLREHIGRNVVKIGKRFYRQKTGIPQGSVLSSILCNFFYAELERDVLNFALGDDCLLLRLLDDFLLITINEGHAKRFVRSMHKGHPEYGVVVKPAKSLVNFDVTTDDGVRIATSGADSRFPYCGVCIDTTTLEVGKKTDRPSKAGIEDSLTVDLTKIPGQTFHRKSLNAFKIQLKAMLIDTSLNSVATVLANLHQSFYEAAVRCFGYARVLSKVRTTCSNVLIKTVDNIIALAYVMLQRRSRSRGNREAKVAQGVISRRQLQWLACRAFQTVFQRKQTQHHALLAWLKASLLTVRMSSEAERRLLEEAIAWRWS